MALTQPLLESQTSRSTRRLQFLTNRSRPCIDQDAEHRKSKQACAALLEEVRQRSALSFQLDNVFTCLFWYKSGYIDGSLLHYSVLYASRREESDASTVRLVLNANADLWSKARYNERSETNAQHELQAIHVAAGIGFIPAMAALLEFAGKDACKMVNSFSSHADRKIHAPIHDAVRNGMTDAVVWLLEKNADASARTWEGFTPLHLLAKHGLESTHGLEDMVSVLVQQKARLDATVGEGARSARGKTALELAAMPYSFFHRPLMYLLAPALQLETGYESNKDSILEDMLWIAGVNVQAATAMAQYVVDSTFMHDRVRVSAQSAHSAALLASVIHMAPRAAAHLLDILVVRPIVHDPDQYALPSRSILPGAFLSNPVRCAYASDATPTKTKHDWPVWRKNEGQAPSWHKQLVRAPKTRDLWSRESFEVETKVVLMPNILNIDVMMALSSADPSETLFTQLPIQGLISCLWDTVVARAFAVLLVCDFIELGTLLVWGWSFEKNGHTTTAARLWWKELFGGNHTRHWTSSEESLINSPTYMPLAWPIIAGGLIRDVMNLMWWFVAHLMMWVKHSFRARQVEGDLLRGSSARALPSLWHVRKLLMNPSVTLGVTGCAVRAFFLYGVSSFSDEAMSNDQEGVLALCVLLHCLRLVYNSRPTNFGRRITLILGACLGKAVAEMVLVTCMVFASFNCAFLVLQREETVGWVSLYLYRGLFFGDGDGFDNLGLDPTKDEETHRMRTGTMLTGTLMFDIVILNLFVAVYSNQYDALAKVEAQLHLKERARYGCRAWLSLRKLPARLCRSRLQRLLLALSVGVAFVVGLCLGYCAPPENRFTWCVASAMCFAFAQVLLTARLMHNEGLELHAERHNYLWICRPVGHEGNVCSHDDLDTDSLKEILDQTFLSSCKRLEERQNAMERKLDMILRASGQNVSKSANCEY